jgi:hypothetical protein
MSKPGEIALRAGRAPRLDSLTDQRALVLGWRRKARNLRVLRSVLAQWQADAYEQCAIELEESLRLVPRETK